MSLRLSDTMRRLCLYAVCLCGVGLLASCATTDNPANAYSNEKPNEIYQHGRSALADKSYGEAIKRFEALEVQYPDYPNAEPGMIDLVYAYYMKEEYAQASSTADRFVKLYPASPHVDYVLYLHGLSAYHQNLGLFEKVFSLDMAQRDLVQVQEAFHSFDELVREHPNSVYAPSAYQYLVYLRNTMALHELQTGQYYYARKAYVAAAERARNVIQYFEGTPATKDAVKLLADSYHALGDAKLEQDARKVLNYNFKPDSVSDRDAKPLVIG